MRTMTKHMSEATTVKPLAVTVKTAREITGLGNTKIYALIKESRLESVAIGRRRLISYASLEALINNRAASGT